MKEQKFIQYESTAWCQGKKQRCPKFRQVASDSESMTWSLSQTGCRRWTLVAEKEGGQQVKGWVLCVPSGPGQTWQIPKNRNSLQCKVDTKSKEQETYMILITA